MSSRRLGSGTDGYSRLPLELSPFGSSIPELNWPISSEMNMMHSAPVRTRHSSFAEIVYLGLWLSWHISIMLKTDDTNAFRISHILLGMEIWSAFLFLPIRNRMAWSFAFKKKKETSMSVSTARQGLTNVLSRHSHWKEINTQQLANGRGLVCIDRSTRPTLPRPQARSPIRRNAISTS